MCPIHSKFVRNKLGSDRATAKPGLSHIDYKYYQIYSPKKESGLLDMNGPFSTNYKQQNAITQSVNHGTRTNSRLRTAQNIESSAVGNDLAGSARAGFSQIRK